jgi:hypothetical protein
MRCGASDPAPKARADVSTEFARVMQMKFTAAMDAAQMPGQAVVQRVIGIVKLLTNAVFDTLAHLKFIIISVKPTYATVISL